MFHVFRAGARNSLTLASCPFVRRASKVPKQPVLNELFTTNHNNNLTEDTVHFDGKLLESLSLVDLDSEKTVAALRSSIQFADKIELIETSADIEPLYTVLEEQHLYLRPDQVTEPSQRAAVLSNAKVTEEDYYVAPPGNIPLAFTKPSN